MADAVIGSQEAALQQQYSQVDWNNLYQEDPAQYAALNQRYQQAWQQVQAQKQALQQQVAYTSQQMRETTRPQALQAIRQQNPDLADDASYSNALGEIKGYLKSIGANEQNFDAVELDPVVFRVARDAARYQALVAKKADVAQKVKAAPKLQRPTPKDQLGAGAKRVAELKARAAKGDSDAQAYLLESL